MVIINHNADVRLYIVFFQVCKKNKKKKQELDKYKHWIVTQDENKERNIKINHMETRFGQNVPIQFQGITRPEFSVILSFGVIWNIVMDLPTFLSFYLFNTESKQCYLGLFWKANTT